ncbi:F-box domain-containing protein [Mycena indigotica]|uniref:F-box domain-containing protein n=1 Tax=Mycena indigotica TaxID=2126181 RepID=A0A8H6T201_9AGAR|nr:F-box domain-containing protein [Mycena indigotica]KAF7309390.1 F-box domain-containing protein [Mycena indigotica]
MPLSWTIRTPRRDYHLDFFAVPLEEPPYRLTMDSSGLASILSNAFQFKRLEFDLPYSTCHLLSGKSLTLLRSFSGRLYPEDLSNMLDNAPILSELEVATFPGQLRIESTTLTKLKIYGLLAPETFLSILRHCPNLTHLLCVVPGCARGCVLAHHLITTHENLRALEIRGPNQEPNFLTHLRLPNLVALNTHHNPTELRPFLESHPWQNHILELSTRVTVSDHAGQALQKDLQRVPHVEALKLYITSGVLTPTFVALGSDETLPLLRRLEVVFIGQYCHDLDYNRILETLDHRTGTLHTFRLVLQVPSQSNVYAPLVWRPRKWAATGFERLMQDGMSFRICYEASDTGKMTTWPDYEVDPGENFELSLD